VNAHDITQLADLRTKFHLGIEMNHWELAELLRLQGRECKELGMNASRPSDTPSDASQKSMTPLDACQK
jgi:hypothetical protein